MLEITALDYNGMDDFETLYLAARIKDDLGKTRQAVEYARRANSITMVGKQFLLCIELIQ